MRQHSFVAIFYLGLICSILNSAPIFANEIDAPALGVKCNKLIDCNQQLVDIANRLVENNKLLSKQISEVENKLDITAQKLIDAEILNSGFRTNFSALLNFSKSNILHPEAAAANQQFKKTFATCPPGEYLVGLEFGWAGTCNRQCDSDGAILNLITPVCRRLQ